MPGYLIVEMDVDKDSWVEAYSRDVPALIESHGGRYLARSTRAELLEGEPKPAFITAILEFPTGAAAKAFLTSEAYRPYAEARRAGASTRMLVLEGR